jgi:meiosis induction protein kinase IME2/SME1
VQHYETPDEEDELLDEALTVTQKAMKRLERPSADYLRPVAVDGLSMGMGQGLTVTPQRKTLRQTQSKPNVSSTNPYPTPSPTGLPTVGASYAQGTSPSVQQAARMESQRKAGAVEGPRKWPTPPYEGSEWSSSALGDIWAAGSRF